MPRRTDIHTILIIGSGPIVIGQGCEFDYSGVQACRALKEEIDDKTGKPAYRVVLVNSNPATIMTDPEFADSTYIEPITPDAIEKILEREAKSKTPIDAVLPTLGGQTGLNTAVACYDSGLFTRYGVQMIGANREAIYRGEDRQVFKDLMISIGLKVPRSGVVHNMDDARKVMDDLGLPLIIRPAFTLGGTGGGIAYNREEFETVVSRGLDASPVHEVLIEQSVIGWKEYELEVMRDRHDNVVIICSIENMDPMGVHTGDSITVAPIQTLTDKEYQRMRDAAIAVIRAVGVETGGSNIQFAVNPDDGEMVVVEMNPRVSRSSALASKATGYPIAKIAAKLAIGYTLDELPNFITSTPDHKLWTSACFEPTIDYCVVKIPRWTFEKFPDADETLTTQMKSVGEAMSIGRTFKEALQKGIRSMEVKRFGFGLDRYDKWLNAQETGREGQPIIPAVPPPQPASARTEHVQDNSDKTLQGESLDAEWPIPADKLHRKLAVPSQGRVYYIRYAMKMGWSIDQIYALTKIDRWFLAQMKQLVDFEDEILAAWRFLPPQIDDKLLDQNPRPGTPDSSLAPVLRGEGRVRGEGPAENGADSLNIDPKFTDVLRQAKQWGYSDFQLATAWGLTWQQVRKLRKKLGVLPVYKLVDTCAAEFEAATPYYYSSYETPYLEGLGSRGSGLERAIASPQTLDPRPSCEDEIRLSDKPKVVIIGGGPNRIGQGIEFDYCCVQAAFAMDELGYESVMVNSNPETVSTDYDTSDLLFFEPLTHEDVLNICERLNGGPLRSSPSPGTPGEGRGEGPSPSPVPRDAAASSRLIDFNNTLKHKPRATFSAARLKVIADIEPALAANHIRAAAAVAYWGAMGTNECGYHLITETHEFWDAVFTSSGSFIGLRRLASDDDRTRYIPEFLQAVRDEIARSLSEAPGEPAAVGEYTHPTVPGNLLKGVIVQFGGQTPLNLSRGLKDAGVPILGTTVESIDAAGDREQFRALCQKLGVKQPANGIARNVAEAREIARQIGYPVLVRPSFVLGGRAMEIVSDEDQLNFYMQNAVEAAGTGAEAKTDSPILIDKFLDNAIEVDVDCVADFNSAEFPVLSSESHHSALSTQHSAVPPQHSPRAVICGVMEHIEEAGIHSGDSACALPPYSLPAKIVEQLKEQTRALAKALRVRGLMNVQYAIKNGEIYIIEVNPRASRTVPFVSKATGIPWAKIAAKVMAGKSLTELGVEEQPDPAHTSVKEVVFPFNKFPGVDVILGPEMRSTGEVMGIDQNFPVAFAKSQIAAGGMLPTSGNVFISVRSEDKRGVIQAARILAEVGLNIIATAGTAEALARYDIPATRIPKLNEGRPNIKDYIKNGQVQLIINTPTKKGPQTDEGRIRAMAVLHKIPMITTITGANAAARAIKALKGKPWGVKPLQNYFQSYRNGRK